MRFTVALLFVIMTAVASGVASVDSGQTPGPGVCDYPAIGHFGMDFGYYHRVCDFPTEINGSHHRCDYEGAAAVATAGISVLIFSAGIAVPVGVVEGACWWACPDLSEAEQPNPPGAWRNYIVPKQCKPVGPPPTFGILEPETGAVTNPGNPNPEATVNP